MFMKWAPGSYSWTLATVDIVLQAPPFGKNIDIL